MPFWARSLTVAGEIRRLSLLQPGRRGAGAAGTGAAWRASWVPGARPPAPACGAERRGAEWTGPGGGWAKSRGWGGGPRVRRRRAARTSSGGRPASETRELLLRRPRFAGTWSGRLGVASPVNGDSAGLRIRNSGLAGAAGSDRSKIKRSAASPSCDYNSASTGCGWFWSRKCKAHLLILPSEEDFSLGLSPGASAPGVLGLCSR